MWTTWIRNSTPKEERLPERPAESRWDSLLLDTSLACKPEPADTLANLPKYGNKPCNPLPCAHFWGKTMILGSDQPDYSTVAANGQSWPILSFPTLRPSLLVKVRVCGVLRAMVRLATFALDPLSRSGSVLHCAPVFPAPVVFVGRLLSLFCEGTVPQEFPLLPRLYLSLPALSGFS